MTGYMLWQIRPLRVVPLVLLAAGLIACPRDSGERRQTYADLVEASSASSDRRAPLTIEFADSKSDSPLLRGFSGPRRDKRRQRSFVTSQGAWSKMVVGISEVRPLRLAIEARALRRSGKRAQRVEIWLNREAVGAVEVPRKLVDRDVLLPEHLMRLGENELWFHYPDLAEAGTEEVPRDRAIAWYRLTLGDGEGPDDAQSTAEASRSLLFVPFGSEVEHLVALRPGSHWLVDGIESEGAASARLQLLVETDEEGPREVGIVSESSGRLDLDLGIATRQPARIIMRALGDGDGSRSGIVVTGPRLTAPIEQTVRSRSRQRAARPNVFVYVVDTLRPDRLGCYGYERPISPAIDAFAGNAVLFEDAIGQSSWTRSSVASLFTGMWPVSHGALGRRDKLSDEVLTLAEGLSESGYRSAAFVTNANLDARFGVSQGFKPYRRIHEHVASGHVTDRVLAWLREIDTGQPLFVYVHTIDPHGRYEPEPTFLNRFAPDAKDFLLDVHRGPRRQAWPSDAESIRHLSDLYDAEIAENDVSFGRLIEGLRELGLYEDSLIAFLSDHGEEFQEHGNYQHGNNLFATTLDFPLIVKFPGQRSGSRSRRLVQHADLMPTVFDLAGLEIPEAVEGKSFADLAGEQAPAATAGPIYSYLHLDGRSHASLVDEEWKLIRSRSRTGEMQYRLFDRVRDRGERHDLAGEMPIRTAVMAAQLETKILASRLPARRESIELDEDLERSLKALGYL